jgi:hypothetical protein
MVPLHLSNELKPNSGDGGMEYDEREACRRFARKKITIASDQGASKASPPTRRASHARTSRGSSK